MSVFDVPRLHFAGIGITRLPTGPRSGHYDLSVNRAVTDEGIVAPERPVGEYHRWVRSQGSSIDATGAVSEAGPFNTAIGWNMGGNSHFWVDAEIVACEPAAGALDTADPVVGRKVDMWGHYNDYLATTHNRARIFDLDPASNWTTAVMVGRLAVGRAARSHDDSYLFSGHVDGVSSPRRRNSRHVCRSDGRPFADFRRQSVVYQFVVDADVVEGAAGLHWFAEGVRSGTVDALRDMVRSGRARGLLVQFALADMAPPQVPDAPDRWRTWGTIAPWIGHEMRTAPEGRLLTARAAGHRSGLHDLSVDIGAEHVTLNAINAVAFENSSWSPLAGGAGLPFARLGDLTLRSATDRVIAAIPQDLLCGAPFLRSAGVLCLPRVDAARGEPDGPLRITAEDGRPLVVEESVQVQVDDASLLLEHASHPVEADRRAIVEVRSFVEGRPAQVRGIEVHQVPNPRAVPLDPVAGGRQARAADARIVGLTTPDRPDERHRLLGLDTDGDGRARLVVHADRAGAARLLLRPPGAPLPYRPEDAGSAWTAYDNDDALGFWSAAGAAAVRVLPDHSHLADIPDDEVTFDCVLREVYATYEHLYSFMTAEIIDLTDEAKARTHSRIVWLMCDPVHRNRTFYMPSTRDMTIAQADLLRRFMDNMERGRPGPPVLASGPANLSRIANREELDAALRMAATIELSVMLQYLYAMWSLPTYHAGRQLVRDGRWTERQLELVCGSGPGTEDGGIRGTLFEVAREEMIHFLVINNIIIATGQPFFHPAVDFTTLNSEIDVPLDMCLERFSVASLSRFVELERPFDPTLDVQRTPAPPEAGTNRARYGSLSELYMAIRAALVEMPEVLLVEPGRGGGEHHLFMRRSLDVRHPDYQLEVDSLSSALFAIDFVTEHGEGNVLAPAEGVDEEAHFETFLRLLDVMRAETVPGPGGRPVPWEPAYPVTRNPTLDPTRRNGDLITDPDARTAVELFNRAYTLTMRMMVQHFGEAPDGSLRRSRLMNGSIDLMIGALRPLAEYVVTLPAGRAGRTAGPTFELTGPTLPLARRDTALRWLARECAELADMIEKVDGLPAQVSGLLRSFAEQFDRDRAGRP